MKWVFLGLALVWSASAAAQPKQVVATCGGVTVAQTGDTINGTANPVGQECVNASVSASITGFSPATTGTPIAVTTGGVSGTLPAGTVVVVSNVGATNGAYCKLGASATTSDQLIPPNSWFAFTVGAATQLTCITSTSTTTVNMVGGAGLPTGSGGGGGASSSGAVTIADGASVTLGAKADAKSTATDTTPITIMSALKQISASVQAMVTSLAGSLTVNLPTGASTSANQTSQITQETASAAALGTTADSVCGTATGTCTLEALFKFLNNAATSAIPTTQSGVATALITCDKSITYDASTNGSTQLVALASGQKTYVCGYSILAAGTVNVELDYGTGTACATGNAKMTPAYQLTAQVGIVDGAPSYRGLATIASNELCLKTSAGVAVQAIVYYTQF